MTEAPEAFKTRIVDCGSCNECCRNDAIVMHPECGDDPESYDTVIYEGRRILAHKRNGDCIYLDRKAGCRIYERRPVVCRELDCRQLLRLPRKMLSPRVRAAAKRLRRRMGDG